MFVSLFFSGILLLFANLAVRYAKNPIRVTLGWTAGILFLPTLVGIVFPAVAFQLVILLAGMLHYELSGSGRRWIPALSLASVLIAYSVVRFIPNEKAANYEHFREKYPLESLEHRLPRVPESVGGDPARLASLEKSIAWEPRSREHVLRQLHDGTMSRFVSNPGFGVLRTVRLATPSDYHLNPEPRDDTPPQPDYFRPPLPGADRWPTLPTPFALARLHETGLLDFVNPRGFGFAKDRRHVAGFQSHGFTRVPDPVEEWKVASLDLVGLLRHDTPVVYVSEKLPRMDDLTHAPTRPLDAFETTALTALRAGADTHTADDPGGIRLLGAIRSARQCVDCHGGERGALLGAFSYRLRPTP